MQIQILINKLHKFTITSKEFTSLLTIPIISIAITMDIKLKENELERESFLMVLYVKNNFRVFVTVFNVTLGL